VRAAALALCLIAALAAGCGGDDEPAAPIEPRSVVLRASDLPGAFSIDERVTGPVGNAEVAENRPEGYEEKLEEWGRVAGYSRQLRREGKPGSGLRAADGVNSVASVYEDEDGATDSFDTGVRDYAEAGFAPQGDLGVGDDGRVFRGTATFNERQVERQVEYTVATWRTGRVIASVVIEGQPGRVTIPMLKELARKQDQRVRTALEA
jgi:hypothetical protein